MSVGQQILFKLGRNEREKKRGKQSHFVPSLLVPPSVIKYYQFGILKMLSYTTSNMKIIMTRREINKINEKNKRRKGKKEGNYLLWCPPFFPR